MGSETWFPPGEVADLLNNHHLISSLLPVDQECLCHPLALPGCISERAVTEFKCHILVIAGGCLMEGKHFDCLGLDLV